MSRQPSPIPRTTADSFARNTRTKNFPGAADRPAASGSTALHRAIVGDPQADGGPNPELVEAYGPIRVTPLRNMPQRQAHASWARFPHFDQGGTTVTSPASAPITSPLGDTNLSSDSIPPPAPPFFQDAAPLPGFNPVDLSSDLPPGFSEGSGVLNADPSLPPPRLSRPEIHTDRNSPLQPEPRLPLFRGAPLPSADFHMDPFSPLQPAGSGSNDASPHVGTGGSIAADLASPVPSSIPRLGDMTSLFGGPDSSDVPPPAPASYTFPIGQTPDSAWNLGAAMGMQSPRLDDETKWGADGPGSFSQFDPSLSGPNDGFLKKYDPNLHLDPNSQGRQPYPPSPLLDPSARSLDTPAQHEDYIPKPDAVDKTYAFMAGYRVDADGAPNSYGGPHKRGLDNPDNARFVIGHNADKTPIYGAFNPDVLVFQNGRPYVQKAGSPSPVSYVSQTSLKDGFYPETDPRRYVNAQTYPYVVRDAAMLKAGVKIGDLATVYNMTTGQYHHAIVADAGPGPTQGEISIKSANDLNLGTNPRSSGDKRDSIVVIPYPGSRIEPAVIGKDKDGNPITSTFIPSPDSIQARGEAYFKARGHQYLQYMPNGDPLQP